MEQAIPRIVARYEEGSLTRRGLIGSLALPATATAQGQPAAQAMTIAGINHVSVQVSDLQRSGQFYRTLGLADAPSDSETARLASGSCHVSLRHGDPVGIVDHFAFGLDRFDQGAVTEELIRRGASPSIHPQFGLHVMDPDGVPVQFTGRDANNAVQEIGSS